MMTFLPPRTAPWIKLLLGQVAALVLTILIVRLAAGRLSFGDPLVLMAQGALAALIGHLMGLPRIWWLQALLPIAIANNGLVPAWLYLAAFVACMLVYWNSASEQVPLYLTNRRTWQALSALVARQNATSLVDLGCGMGGVTAFLARERPALRSVGVENAPLVFLAAWFRVLVSRQPNAQIVYKSIWDEHLATYDIVYCFLSPVPMPRLYEKARCEMRPGTLLVSNSFTVPGHEPDEVVAVDDGRKTQLYLYRM